MGKVAALARLTRIEHSLMLLIAVLAAELISGRLPGPFILAMSLITPVLVSAGSFAINDYFDVEADRANRHMRRPLVSGKLSRREALYYAAALLVAGPVASLFINPYAFAIAVIFSALAFLYSYRLKDMLLVGNVYIAASMAIPFLYGNLVVSGSFADSILLVSVVIFLSGLAREIHGMVRDRRGDRSTRGSRNLVHHVGAESASYMALILYAEAIAIRVYMFLLYPPFAYNLVYMIPIAAVDLMLAYVAVGQLFMGGDLRFQRLSRNLSLAAMAIALLAYLASAIFYLAA